MTQDDKINALLKRISCEVEDFFQEFNRPARSSSILKKYRSGLSRIGLDWQAAETKLKEKGLIRVRRHEQTNNKWYFPPLPECTDEVLSEMVSLMDN